MEKRYYISLKPPIILDLPDDSQIHDLKWMHVWSQSLDMDLANLTFPDEIDIEETIEKPESGKDLIFFDCHNFSI